MQGGLGPNECCRPPTLPMCIRASGCYDGGRLLSQDHVVGPAQLSITRSDSTSVTSVTRRNGAAVSASAGSGETVQVSITRSDATPWILAGPGRGRRIRVHTSY